MPSAYQAILLFTPYHQPGRRQPEADDIRRDHWLRFDLTGAYSIALRTRFNGFGYGEIVVVETEKERRWGRLELVNAGD